MLERYIVEKGALNILDLQVVDANKALSEATCTIDKHLCYSHLPYLSLMLDVDQVTKLKIAGFSPRRERISEDKITLSSDYEKTRTSFYKINKKGLQGRDVKVGHLDSGVASAIIPIEFANNFVATSITTEDEFGHGTETASIIKHPTMGLAPSCIFHNTKMVDSTGGSAESWILAALNYVLANSLDIINLSWTFYSPAMVASIASIVANNTVVVAASGNSGVDDSILIPAALPNVVAVNSITSAGAVFFRNVYPNTFVGATHGIDVACNGVGCELYNKNGIYTSSFGTSFAAPYFVGVFALYKEELQESNNYKVLQQVYDKAQKTSDPLHFGRGTLIC